MLVVGKVQFPIADFDLVIIIWFVNVQSYRQLERASTNAPPCTPQAPERFRWYVQEIPGQQSVSVCANYFFGPCVTVLILIAHFPRSELFLYFATSCSWHSLVQRLSSPPLPIRTAREFFARNDRIVSTDGQEGATRHLWSCRRPSRILHPHPQPHVLTQARDTLNLWIALRENMCGC